MNARAVAVAVAVAAILLPLAAVAFAPASDDALRLSRATLPPSEDSALVIADPSVGFNDGEAAALYAWIFEGGRLLLVDDSVVGVDLTARMGAPVEIVSARLYSPIFDGTPERIPVLDLGTVPGLPSGLTTSRPLLVVGGHDAVLVPTLTWADRNDNGRPDLDEVLAQGSILSVVDIGTGMLLILSDPTLYDRPDVAEALHAFLTDEGARTLVRDASHETRVDPYSTNAVLTTSPPRAASVALLVVVAIVLFVAIARPLVERVAPRRPPRADDELVRRALSELE